MSGGTLRGIVRDFTVDVSTTNVEIELQRTENSELPPLISGIELIAFDSSE